MTHPGPGKSYRIVPHRWQSTKERRGTAGGEDAVG